MTLSPKSSYVVLLPEDRELIAVLGITEAQYRYFVREGLRRSKVEPGKPQAILFVPFVINLVVGLALSYVGSLLAPKSSGGSGPNIRQTQKQGQNIVSQTEFAPKAGFDSLQNVVELGSTIPVIYAKRETIGSSVHGGVRVNTNLIWSQMQSFGGNQLLRAIFLIGEGGIGPLDPSQFAFGDNTLSGYDLGLGNASNSRVTFYSVRNGGRIKSADRIAGRTADKDPGNAQNSGAPDVFHVKGLNNNWTPDFCYAYTPGTQTQFGVYSFIGVGFAYRVNPSMRPAVVVNTKPEGKEGKVKLQCDPDGVAIAQRAKYNNKFSCYSGVTQINYNDFDSSSLQTLNVGDVITYTIDRKSDAKKIFRGNQTGNDHRETCNDVAQAVAGRQKSWDDSCAIGDLYQLGTAQLVCESRSPIDEIFSSKVDQEPIGGGQTMQVTFKVVKSGVAEIGNTTDSTCATSSSHLLKLAICSFMTARACQVLELGFKSTLGIRFSGLCNFRDALSHRVIDGRACKYYERRVYGKGQSLGLSNYSSGTFSGAEQRYSFFKIAYRVAGSNGSYVYMEPCFGFRGATQQSQFNYIRLQMPSYQVWEFRIEPISGWAIRYNYATGDLYILDSKKSATTSVTSNGVIAVFSGSSIQRTKRNFQMPATKNRSLGVTLQDSKDYADEWGRLAEAFVYEEIQTSARSPEHELKYINIITPNLTTPTYNNLALIGMNIRSSTEFAQLKQLSVYVDSGLNGIHSFPEVLKDLLLNSRYGVGSTLSSEQVDTNSFNNTATWTRSQGYFWDGTIPEPVNIRQWASTTASYFLLDFIVKNGRFALQPSVYFDQPEPITNLYTSGNILEGTFEFSYADVEQRNPKRISVKWRHERPSNANNSPGIFPLIREVNVREVGTPEDAPLETKDLSDFCTSEDHAIDIAKFLCRTSRLITHAVKFKTVPTKAGLEIGRCFKLGLETVNYTQPNNGVINNAGFVISNAPLPNGTYDVLLWDGVTTSIQETSITISNGSTSQFTNVIFCLKDVLTDTVAYKVQSLSFDEDGNLEVSATVFPLESNGYSSIVTGWNVSGNWIIEGVIGGSQNDQNDIFYFDGVEILGPSSLTLDSPEEYTAVISGSNGSYTYQWFGSGLYFSQPNAATTEITATVAPNLTVGVTVTCNGISVTETRDVEVFYAETSLLLIGTPSIIGSATAEPNIEYTYKINYPYKPAAIAATALVAGEAYQIVSLGTTDFTTIGATSNTVGTVFTATAVGTGTGTVDDIDIVFTAWSWNATSTTADASYSLSGYPLAKITFAEGGSYNITCTVSSPTAADSPQTASLAVLVVVPVVTVVATDPDASEGVGNPGLFTLTRTGSASSELVVNISVTGTAVNGLDFTRISTAASFAIGATTTTISVSVLTDSEIEQTETVSLVVLSGSGYDVGSQNVANVFIKDAMSLVSVSATDSTATEVVTGSTQDSGQFTISRTGITSTEITINIQITGTASNGIDYNTISSVVTLAAGVSSTTVDISVIDDAIIESSETVVLTLLPGQGYTISGSSSAQINIVDNDLPFVTISTTDSNASEPSDTGAFLLTRTGFTTSTLSVNLTFSGTATAGTDYTTLPSTVTFAVGSTTAELTVTPIDDSVAESSETIIATVASGTGYTVGSPSAATVTLFDNEPADSGPPVVTISASDAIANEPTDPGTFTLTRTGSTATTLTVNLTVSGTATAGTDYIALPSTATFAVNSTSIALQVTPIDDTLIESSETVVVTIATGTGYTVGSPSAATVTLLDNESSSAGGGGGGSLTDSTFSNNSLLINFDGTAGSNTAPLDLSVNHLTLVVQGTATKYVTTASPAKYAQSGFFNNGARIQIPASSLFSFPGDYEIQFWFWMNTRVSYATAFELGTYQNGIMLRVGSSDAGVWIQGNQLAQSSLNSLAVNTWHHFAACRLGSSNNVYFNGSQVAFLSSTATINSTGAISYLGDSTHSPGRWFDGYMDDLRIKKGISTLNGNFIPAGPFPTS